MNYVVLHRDGFRKVVPSSSPREALLSTLRELSVEYPEWIYRLASEAGFLVGFENPQHEQPKDAA